MNWGKAGMSSNFACSYINGIACYFLTTTFNVSTGIHSASVSLTNININCRTSDGKVWYEPAFFLVIGS